MRYSTRFILAGTLAAGLVASGLTPASAAFDSLEAKCRSTVAKGGSKYTKAVLKALTSCHKNRDKDGSFSSDNCNLVADADPDGKVAAAATKWAAGVASKCVGVTPSAVLYQGCPAPCDGTVPTVTTFDDVLDCQTCLATVGAEDAGDDAFGNPTSPNPAAISSCHSAITKNGAKLYNTIVKNVIKCQATAEKAGSEVVDDCTTGAGFSTASDLPYQAAAEAIYAACDGADDPQLPNSLDACGGSTTAFELGGCVADAMRASAQEVAAAYLALGAGSSTTTTTIGGTGEQDPQCPDLGELVLYSKHSTDPCTNDSECVAPRTCNLTTGFCETVTRLDSGWNGLGHGGDINDQVATRATLRCEGPNTPTGCGECTVTGIDPQPGNCRCRGDIRTICDQPFETDVDDCVGLTGENRICDCYLGGPFPLSAGGTPVCVVNRFANDISGTANVDEGSGEITANLRTRVYLGIGQDQPCPVCAGKCSDSQAKCRFDSECVNNDCVMDTPGDGDRDGVCDTGASANLACDASGVNADFPMQPNGAMPGGGLYSLDCMPNTTNVTGQGLRIDLTQRTGYSSTDMDLDCDGAGPRTDLCHCMVCSKDSSEACDSDADCAPQGNYCSVYSNAGRPLSNCNSNADCTSVNLGTCGGTGKCTLAGSVLCTTNADCTAKPGGTCTAPTCSEKGTGTFPEANTCTGGACIDDGDGNGTCATGPDDKYCDGYVRSDGTGVAPCSTDADCELSVPGAGTCTSLKRRGCFLPLIEATGSPDPEFPVAAATFCIPPTANNGVNLSAGLPGPGKVINQGGATTFCASDHNVQYTPGGNTCP